MKKTLLATVVLLSFIQTVFGADWPMYRFDAARTAATPESVPDNMELLWTYKSRHAPRPAWPKEERMVFDHVYRTVIGQGLLYFGSSVDGAVRCLDAATGEKRWTFFTGAPVRFAPVIWKEKVFVASDDGYLYCLTARDGKLLWKKSGGPDDSMVIGNGHMVSRWPARGGPVVVDDAVYFAAGVWPTEGVYVYSLDAESGKVNWVNDTSGSLKLVQPHHAPAQSGVSSQGHLVASADRLFVTAGRAVPAAFNRNDGGFLYFHIGANTGNGGSVAMVVDPYLINGGYFFNAADGTSFCMPKKGVERDAQMKLSFAASRDYIVYRTRNNSIAILERRNPFHEKQVRDRKGVKTTVNVPLIKWRVSPPPEKIYMLIIAGKKIAYATAGKVGLLKIGQDESCWSAKVEGIPYGLAAADGKLYVSTDKGHILCFGKKTDFAGRVIEEADDSPPPDDNPLYAKAADEIIRETKITKGYCLDVECGDGALSEQLARKTNLKIYATDPDPAMVALARKRLVAAGLYGTRVTVHQASTTALPYPNYFANLVVSGRAIAGDAVQADSGEIARVLRPFGGTVYIGKSGAFKKTVRGALKGAGDWTHQYADASNTGCSTDTAVRGPLRMLWFTDPDDPVTPQRHGRAPVPLAVAGRLYVLGLDALRAVDAYNGHAMWEFPLKGVLEAYDKNHLVGVAGTGSVFCAAGGDVYVRYKDRIIRVDGASGKKKSEYPAPQRSDGAASLWGHIGCVGDTLYGTIANTKHIVKWTWSGGKSDMTGLQTESSALIALDTSTGKTKWRFAAQHSIRHNAIAFGSSTVFLIDRPIATHDRLRGEKKPHPPGVLVALDGETGKIKWKSTRDIFGTMLALSEKHDALLMGYLRTSARLPSEKGGRMACLRASTGKSLWEMKDKYKSRPLISNRTVYAQPGAWDLLTGKPTDFILKGRTYGCGTIAGSPNLLIYRSGTLGYSDLTRATWTENYGGFRPGCWINAIPASGLVLVPDASAGCACSYQTRASLALQPYGLYQVTFTPNGGAFAEAQTVHLRTKSKGCEIRYTLDGATPTKRSLLYTKPFKLSQGARVKARVFSDGQPPSVTTGAKFVIDGGVLALEAKYWSVHDVKGSLMGPSNWALSHGVVGLWTHVYTKDDATSNPQTPRYGTFRIYKRKIDTSRGVLNLKISSVDNDGLGVAFRFKDPEHHYLWAMDAQRSYHVLACKNGTEYRVLASNKKSYTKYAWNDVRIVLDGARIKVYVNGRLDLEATDKTFANGTIALHGWYSYGVTFRDIIWKAAATR